MNRFRFLLVALVVLAAALTGPHRSQALHRNTPNFVQVTSGAPTAIGDPRFAGRSNVLVFHAAGDLLGNGNVESQIFVFDLAGRVKKGELSLYQLTAGAGASSAPSAAKRGRVLAFQSEADLLGNGSAGRQVFASTLVKWKKNLVPLFQVTRGPGESFDAAVNESGKFLLFSSTDDLLAEGLAPGEHLYRSDLRRLPKTTCPGYPCPVEGNPGLTRITAAEVDGATIDKKGLRVAFASRADAAGTGCGTGVLQIFLWDQTTGGTTQVTCGDADSRNPIFTHNYRGVLFESDADLLASGSTHTQIYHLDLLADQLSQLTFGSDGDSAKPAPNGTTSINRFFFTSTAQLTGSIPAGVERLYLYDPAHQLERLTEDQPIASRLTAQFQFAAFASDADFVGNGNHELQLFLVNAAAAPALDPTPTPTPTVTATPTPTFTAAPTPALVRLSLAPAEKTLTVGETETFTATGHWSDGSTQNVTQLLVYASSAPLIVAAPNEVGNRSRVEALAPGEATISASYPGTGVTTTATGDDATITVLGALDHIVVGPASKTLSIGEIETYTATGHYVGGGTQNLTQVVDWASSDPDVAAALNTPGNKSQVQAVAPGQVTISATDPGTGVSSTDSGDDGVLTVIGPLESITLAPASKTLAVGGFETYTATGHYQGGGTQNLTQQVTYFSSDPAVATAPNTPGNKSRVNAVGAGVATIHAEHLGISSNDATLTVVDP